MERAPDAVRENPEDWELVAAEGWRMARGELRKCRWTTRRPGCPNPVVAAVNRSSDPLKRNWWFYCEDHMFGRVIVNETVCWWRRIQ